MKRFVRYFFKGLGFLIPVVVTMYVVYAVFTSVDDIYKFPYPGLGFLVTILAITLIGFVGSNFLTKKMVTMLDAMFCRVPLIKIIYNMVKDMTGALMGDKKSFDKPVFVSFSDESGIGVIGFVTNESLESIGLPGKVIVYLPQSYNFAGNVLVVPREKVRPLEANGGSVIKIIVSGGITK